MKIISQGAEAIIYSGEHILKKRVRKGYRHPDIDFELRRSRTNREAKILEKIPVPAPKLISVDKTEMTIEMENIPGKKLSMHLEELDYKTICKNIGKNIAKMHDKNIIHGDLTTSNMIFSDRVYFIDFGLSYTSTKLEDKAVDLHLLKQALLSRHNSIYQQCWDEIRNGYNQNDVLRRLEQVEKRGRHKTK